MNTNYSVRTIVFLDILGFKNIVRKPRKTKEIARMLNGLHSIKERNGESVSILRKKYKEKLEIAFFSDSLVLSCEPEQAYFMLEDVTDLQLDLMRTGVFIRGCVAAGNLFHNGNFIYGPALIEAYEGESKMAKYPRIILDKSYKRIGTMFCKDYDGIYFLDPFRRLQEKIPNNGISLDKTIRDIIIHVMNNINDKNNNSSIKSKYEWLLQLINEIFFEDKECGEYKYFWPSNSTYDRTESHQNLRDYYLHKRSQGKP